MNKVRKSQTCRRILLVIIICIINLSAQAQYSGGTGEPNDPYQIGTVTDWVELMNKSFDWDKSFILIADIDFQGVSLSPVGTGPLPFTGSFNGNGHIFNHVTINQPSNSRIGLFGSVDKNAQIRNLGVINVIISGNNDVGGLAGQSFDSSISNCYVTGSVSGNRSVGGLVGVKSDGTLNKCYSTGAVSGVSDIGGLVGHQSGSVIHCYSTAIVNGVQYLGGLVGSNLFGDVTQCYSTGAASGSLNVGGLVGYNLKGYVTQCYCTGKVNSNSYPVSNIGGMVGLINSGAITKSFWDTETSGWSTSSGGIGKTTAEMYDPNIFISDGWDFVGEIKNGTNEVWQVPQAEGYPVLSFFNGYVPPQLTGLGTPNEPYLISDANQLGAIIHYNSSANYKLSASIGLSGIHWGTAIIPYFEGKFDGNNLTISNMTIDGTSYIGLFGIIFPQTQVRKTGINDVNITSSGDYTGGLVGYNYGTVIQCYTSGIIKGNNYIGGLAGYSRGNIHNCYSNTIVDSNNIAGGLLGCHTSYGSIDKCFSIGNVTSIQGYAGGLIGTAVFEGISSYPNSGQISNSFWDIETSGQNWSAGGIGSTGKTTTEMQTKSTFTDACWDFVGETANGTEDIWWINEGKDYPKLSWQGSAGMVFVNIPAGTFQMGNDDDLLWIDTKPVHAVILDSFQISKYETTNSQYAEFLNSAMTGGLIQVVNGLVYASSDANLVKAYCDTYTSSSYSQIEYSEGRFTVRTRDGKAMSDHPVTRVSWYGAKAFCDFYGFSLPTEAEWEYAARGGYHDPYYQYPWGSNSIDCSKANCKTNSGFCNPLNLTSWPYTSPVGYYGPQGAYGLCDISGNLWEWCRDWYDSSYYSVSPIINPTGPTGGTYRVLRGGAWDVSGTSCNVAGRSVGDPAVRGQVVGFRVCR